VSVFTGAGDGAFGLRVDYAVGMYPEVSAVGDLNRDGTPDLVVVNSGSNSISVFEGARTH